MRVAAKWLFWLVISFEVCHAQAAKPAEKFVWDSPKVQIAKGPLARERKISAADRAQLQKMLAQQYKGESDPRKLAADTRVQLVDLNGDGVPEIIAQAVGDYFCSPTGNCAFWVFQKTTSGYRVIMEKGAAQGFTIHPNGTIGYSDVVLTM